MDHHSSSSPSFGLRQPSLGNEPLWTEEYDDFFLKFQREEPELFLQAIPANWNLESTPLSALPPPPPPFAGAGDDLTLPPSPQQQLHTTDLPSLQRSNSKRPRGGDDDDHDHDHDHDHKGKRNRKIENGFPCEEDGCDKCFDRACDLSKHRKRVHVSKEERPHQCTQCPQRFCWPKDVKRHLAQVHGVDAEPTTTTTTIALPHRSGALSLAVKHEPHDIRMTGTSPTSPTSPKPSSSSTMAWLTRSLVMLKKLRLRSRSLVVDDDSAAAAAAADDHYIFVTLDRRDFRMVDVHGVHSADALARRLAAAFAAHAPQIRARDFRLHRFRAPGGRLGEPLAGDALMAAISTAERAKRTLRLFLTMKGAPSQQQQQQQQQSSFFGGGGGGGMMATSPVSTFS